MILFALFVAAVFIAACVMLWLPYPFVGDTKTDAAALLYAQRRAKLLSDGQGDAKEHSADDALLLELERTMLREAEHAAAQPALSSLPAANRFGKNHRLRAATLVLPLVALLSYGAFGAWRDVAMQNLIFSASEQARDPETASRIIAYLQARLAQTPQATRIRYQLGIEYLKTGETAAALAVFEQMLAARSQADEPLLTAIVERLRDRLLSPETAAEQQP